MVGALERTEAPTASRIAELRTRGVVSQSRALLGAIAFGVIVLCVNRIGSTFGTGVARLWNPTTEFSLAELSAMCDPLLIFFLPAALVLAFGFLGQVLQTKFLLLPRLVAFSLTNGIRFDRFGPRSILRGMFFALVRGACVIAVSVGILLISIREAAVLVQSNPEALSWYFHRIADKATPLLAGVTLLFVALLHLRARLAFRVEHRMTRKEVLRERNG